MFNYIPFFADSWYPQHHLESLKIYIFCLTKSTTSSTSGRLKELQGFQILPGWLICRPPKPITSRVLLQKDESFSLLVLVADFHHEKWYNGFAIGESLFESKLRRWTVNHFESTSVLDGELQCSSIHETFTKMSKMSWAGRAVALNHSHCHNNRWSQNFQRNMYSSGWNPHGCMVSSNGWISQYTPIFLKYTHMI